MGIVLDGALEALIDDDQSFQAPRSIGMPSNSILYQPGYQHHLHQNSGDKPSLYLFLAWRSAPTESLAGERSTRETRKAELCARKKEDY